MDEKDENDKEELKIECPICGSENTERKSGSFGRSFYTAVRCVECDERIDYEETRLEDIF
jgi:ssDNA-binding Zn-finger/Zn-ribbon topoisomerase 1